MRLRPTMTVPSRFVCIVGAALALISCDQLLGGKNRAAKTETADEFVTRVNREYGALGREAETSGFVQNTYITHDTEYLNARANERKLEYLSGAVKKAQRYAGEQLSATTARAIERLKLDVAAPAPDDAGKRAELTTLMARMEALYGQGKYCPSGPESCRNLDQLSETLATSRDYDALLKAWEGWHDTGAQMRDEYQKFVRLANEGARDMGYENLGVMWRSGYDMTPEAFEAETDRLWSQVEPLYQALHCHTRGKLAARYGESRVPAGKPIPAHLLGNMWAQQWNKIYDDILKPYPKASIESADRRLKSQNWDALRMTRSAESFYTSLGLPQLPQTFWERSMFTRPRDREVVCHASAWTLDNESDVRIKMCMQPTEEELFTIYHELGHVYYYLLYKDQPYLFQAGAHDGFHEAVGDTVNLSVTPQYLAKIGLIGNVKPSQEAVINQQMKMALDKIAFLPFGKVIDQWRWRVFAGDITPQNYNASWWRLRERYQGIAPAVARTERHFDPAAKYHIPGNTPYTRYFLSFILQFQFHKALCAAAGFKGPLHECSVFGSEEAGRRLAQMLSRGASEPWQDTLEKLTGTREMDASAIIEYFQPLMRWLKEQNKDQQCGW